MGARPTTGTAYLFYIEVEYSANLFITLISHSWNCREYEPDMSSDDDEDTIAKDEDVREEGEIDMLNEEADIPVEELLRKFHPELYDNKDQGNEVEQSEKTDAEEESENESDETDDSSDTKDSVKNKEDDHVGDNDSDQDNLKTLVDEDPALFDAVETAEAFPANGQHVRYHHSEDTRAVSAEAQAERISAYRSRLVSLPARTIFQRYFGRRNGFGQNHSNHRVIGSPGMYQRSLGSTFGSPETFYQHLETLL